jgi:ubiquinone/menaquinone biosynthesis C-methylase UbiE
MVRVGTATNHWPDAKCAKAFWGQQELPPYRDLLNDTIEWAAPKPGEEWLDLGSGGGPLTRGLWEASQGQVASVVGTDVAPVNTDAYRRLARDLNAGERIRFVTHNFSEGLAPFPNASYDAVVSGLSITYAEDFDEATQKWTTAAYDRVFHEVFRVLRPGGRFVFSVNVPEPNWGKIARQSFAGLKTAKRPLHYLKKSWRMMKYGQWLKREARTGRFHYFPADQVEIKVRAAGFIEVEHRLSYSDQAFIFRCYKPA